MQKLDVIPVIDLLGGDVVHARRGERGAYRPIVSPLVSGSAPMDVCRALIALAPFGRLYVADLDSIRGSGTNDAVIEAMSQAFPDLEIWVDRGETDPAALRHRARNGPGITVVGAESFSEIEALSAAVAAASGVLSLDYDASGRMGPPEVYDDPALWPDRVIVMTLASVGSGGGPDMERLGEALVKAGDRAVYAAGGVRNLADLRALADIGVSGALVASALHDGSLTPAGLAAALGGRP